MNCIVFTNNEKKCRDISYVLSTLNVHAYPYQHICKKAITVIEDGLTFQENAHKKVEALAHIKDCFLLADDSGLEVDTLGGEPGIFSARYGGPSLSDDERCLFLLEKMKHHKNRTAHFRCAIAAIFPNGKRYTFHGKSSGILSHTPIGTNGFGYDPIFIPLGYSQTYAELGPSFKKEHSHRAKALDQTVNMMKTYLSSNTFPAKPC